MLKKRLLILITLIFFTSPTYAKDCTDNNLKNQIKCLTDELSKLSKDVEQLNHSKPNLKTKYLEATTNNLGEFSVRHYLNPNEIKGVTVAIQHVNGSWYTLDQSNNITNRVYWTNKDIVGAIYLSNFHNKHAKVVVFY